MKKRFVSGGVRGGMEIEDYVMSATEKEATRMERPIEKRWLDIFWWAIVLCVGLLSVRVFYIAGLKGAYYRSVAKGNSVRSTVIKAPRGRIFDRNGVALVSNIPSVDAVAIPADLPHETQQRKELSATLGEILHMNEGDVWSRMESVDQKSLNPVLIKDNISQDESLVLLEQAANLKGIRIEKTAIREYADSKVFSHVLGYEGKIEKKELDENQGYLLTDYIGKQGVEKSYEKYLRGVHGANQVEVDSMGNPKRDIGVINPKAGSDLVLAIDAQLQKRLFDSIVAILEKTGTKTAAAVALDPRNGEVLALVNVPSYDNNLFAQKISQQQYTELIQNPDKPLFNRAIAGEYPPGSTVKPVMAAAALSEGVISPSTIIEGMGGVLSVGNFSFRDWKAHGPSDVRTAIAESNDIFFYSIGGGYGNIEGLGMNRMKKYYGMFGFGNQTGIDIGGEENGFVPDEQWKLDKIGEKWYLGNSYHAAIGQGYVTATPLQIANAIVPIANGGTLYKPHIVQKIKKSDGEIINQKSEVVREGFVSDGILQVVREGMRQTVTSGTAQPLKDLPVAVAGKTGTAQFGNEDKTHGWFVSYAPYENPEIVLAVLVEGGGEGHSSGVPVTKEIYQWYFGEYDQK